MLHSFGSATKLFHARGGYPMGWWRRIIDVLCVMCASVRFGSISTTALSGEIFESFHLGGKNIFHCTSLRSSSLKRVNQLTACSLSCQLILCWRKNVVTWLRLSVASTQYANAPSL